jgi:hypothetical protein
MELAVALLELILNQLRPRTQPRLGLGEPVKRGDDAPLPGIVAREDGLAQRLQLDEFARARQVGEILE